jgi:hypothetical protein
MKDELETREAIAPGVTRAVAEAAGLLATLGAPAIIVLARGEQLAALVAAHAVAPCPVDAHDLTLRFRRGVAAAEQAVVVRGGHVVAAGVRVPQLDDVLELTQDGIPPEHVDLVAAVGLATEERVTVVVVEGGRVSIAHPGGRLDRSLATVDEVAARLQPSAPELDPHAFIDTALEAFVALARRATPRARPRLSTPCC